MSQESLVVKICNCIETLTNGKKTDSSPNKSVCKDKKEALFNELKKNIHFAFEVIEKSDDLKAAVKQYTIICHKKKCKNCDYLNFLELSLVLLKLLSEFLKAEESEQNEEKSDKASVPKGMLSISQQKIIKKCLQFVVALGILPNLLRGIGVPLSRRLEYAKLMENFSSDILPRQKHAQVAICVETLLNCAERSALQGIILSYHGTDLLAALFQLCYAPIKKIDNAKSTEVEINPDLSERYFALKLAIIRDYSSFTDEQLINEMTVDRGYFRPKLEKFLKQICPSLLFWELLLFQGIPVRSHDLAYTISKVPLWLKKICSQMLTEMILQNHGIASFVQVVLDKAYDVDIQQGVVDNARLDAVALLIVYNPVRHISFEDYIGRLSKQVLDLLQLKNSKMDKILHYVASSVILNICDRDYSLADEYFLKTLFMPLRKSVTSTAADGNIVVTEKDLTHCIENIHKMFILNSSPLSRNNLKLLYPFFHCFSQMFFFLDEGVSPLKSKVKDLMIGILKNGSDEDAITFLHIAVFSTKVEDEPIKMFKTTVSFAYGDEGSLMAVQPTEERTLTIDANCYAILKLMVELKNKNLNRMFFLLVLREFCHYLSDVSQDCNNSNYDKLRSLFSAFIQELAEWDIEVRQALMGSVAEVSDMLMILLDIILKWEGNGYEETIMIILMILNNMLFGSEELSSADFTALKKCLPSLEKLMKKPMNNYMREMVLVVITYMATHGVAGGGPSYEEIMKKCLTKMAKKPSETLIQDITEDLQKSFKNKTSSNSSASQDPTNMNCIFGDLSGASTSEKSSDLASDLERMLKLNRDLNKKLDEFTSFEKAILDIKDTAIPVKGHGLIAVGNLLSNRDKETLCYKKELLEIFKEGLDNDDSYVYLSAIQCLSMLADIDAELVLPTILKVYQNPGDKNAEFVLKAGEVLLKICRLLGDLVYKYRDQLLHTYLIGAKHDDPQIRSSSLSNLGEACMYLKFSISGPWVQEILICVLSLLKTDKDLEVRRCAVMVITLLLRGVGKDFFQILEDEIKDIYGQLKIVYNTESDDVLRLHSQLALEEINTIMKELLFVQQPFTKEIRILHH